MLGYLFYSKLPVMNLGTGVLSYSAAWQRSETNHKIQSDQVRAVFRNEHFYMYEAPTIATLITGAEVSDKLDGFLTMIATAGLCLLPLMTLMLSGLQDSGW